MKRLVECVSNFSEGRDASKVDAIVAAIRDLPGIFLLDRESDADHNRSVITFAGEPEAVLEAAVRGVGKAAGLIDLTHHTGAHPRIGAADVLPFVPVEGVSLEDCVTLAKKAGREIWERFRIPVYFYEAAAERPGRTNLENIRKGQFEGLREEILHNPDRAPDIGGPELHSTAGAIAVGARKFLIAYNINLNTADLEIAKRIAKKIRFSSGGLPCVKAMGVDLRTRKLAQVSANLTDFEQTPIHTVFDLVKKEAEAGGVSIAGSEIVGLVPRRALEITAEFHLKLENFSPAQVLENRVEAALAGNNNAAGTLASLAQPFLDEVARPTATPGGGSVAALAGALAANLGQMVASLSLKKKSQAAHAESLAKALAKFQAESESLAQAIDLDAQSFEFVMAAHKLPKDSAADGQKREDAIQRSLKHAAEIPLQVARRAVQVFAELRQLETMSGPSMLSDIRVGQAMAAAAVRGGVANVSINLESISDAAYAGRLRAECTTLASQIPQTPAV